MNFSPKNLKSFLNFQNVAVTILFHRYLTMKTNPGIYEKTNGLLPIVVIDKDINQRMASTVRHNRARQAFRHRHGEYGL